MKQNNSCYLFGMYEPDTNSVIVNALNNTYTGTPLTISCKKCNSHGKGLHDQSRHKRPSDRRGESRRENEQRKYFIHMSTCSPISTTCS